MYTQLQRDFILGGIGVAREYVRYGDFTTASNLVGLRADAGKVFVTLALTAACQPKYCEGCEEAGFPSEYFTKDPVTGKKGLYYSKMKVNDFLTKQAFWMSRLDTVQERIVNEEIIPYAALPENYLDLELTWFKFGARINNAFDDKGVRTLRDLLSLKSLRIFHNLGKQSDMIIQHTLEHYGLSLGVVPSHAIPVDLRPRPQDSGSANLYIHTLGTNSILGTIMKYMIESSSRPSTFNINYQFSLVSDIGAEIATSLHYLNGYRPVINVKDTGPEAT